MTETLALCGGPKAVRGNTLPWPPIGAEDVASIQGLVQRGELSYYGREGVLRELEDAFIAYHGVKYALGVSSGTAALHSAYVACGIGPTDEVIAPTHTFLATVTPILATNGLPVLVDCETDNEGVCPAAIEEAVTPKTKAIVVTHLWGHPVEMDAILSIAARHRLLVIEDCSHAHGATYRGRKVGTLGDVGCFSLQGKKIVAAGQGGIMITNNQEIYERAALFGHFRVRAEQSVESPVLKQFTDTGFGLNYRMHPLAASLALTQFKQLDTRIAARREKLDHLTRALAEIPGISPPSTRQHVTRGGYYGYKPRYVQDEMRGLPLNIYIKALQAEGLEVKRAGSAPLHLSALFAGATGGLANFAHSRPDQRRAYKRGDFPMCEQIHDVALSLPTFTYEAMDLVDQYADGFRKVAANLDQLHQLHNQA